MPDDDWGVDELIDKIFVKPTPPPTGPPLPPRTLNGNGDHGSNYARKALDDECAALAAMGVDSGRNVACNNAAFNLGQLIATGELDEAEVRWRLAEAMHRNGYVHTDGEAAAIKTISSGIAGGKANPRGPRRQLERPLADNWDIFTGGRPQAVQGPVDAGQADPLAPSFVTAEAGSSSPAVTPERVSSWLPTPINELAARMADEPEPSHLARYDGHRLFYSGRVNGLLGESESGKTWIALLAVLQAIGVDERVLFLDFEDSAKGIVERLAAMGATDEQLGRVHYALPDESLDLTARDQLGAAIVEHRYNLIVVDGINAAMALMGYKLENNTDATRFAQELLKPLARTGACVITIDHVPKNSGDTESKGGIGAQAKRAMITGCALLAKTPRPFGRGQYGEINLTVDKDRRGHVRQQAVNGRGAGVVKLTPGIGDALTVHIEIPDRHQRSGDSGASGDSREITYTVLAQRISRLLETTDGAPSGNTIEKGVEGDDKAIRAALRQLVEAGYVKRAAGPRGAILHQLVHKYREGDKPIEEGSTDPETKITTTSVDLGATSVPTEVQLPLVTSVSPPPLRGGPRTEVSVSAPPNTETDQTTSVPTEVDDATGKIDDFSPPRKMGKRGDRVIDLATGEDLGPAATPPVTS